jgi:hypothetical protein
MFMVNETSSDGQQWRHTTLSAAVTVGKAQLSLYLINQYAKEEHGGEEV